MTVPVGQYRKSFLSCVSHSSKLLLWCEREMFTTMVDVLHPVIFSDCSISTQQIATGFKWSISPCLCDNRIFYIIIDSHLVFFICYDFLDRRRPVHSLSVLRLSDCLHISNNGCYALLLSYGSSLSSHRTSADDQ